MNNGDCRSKKTGEGVAELGRLKVKRRPKEKKGGERRRIGMCAIPKGRKKRAPIAPKAHCWLFQKERKKKKRKERLPGLYSHAEGAALKKAGP